MARRSLQVTAADMVNMTGPYRSEAHLQAICTAIRRQRDECAYIAVTACGGVAATLPPLKSSTGRWFNWGTILGKKMKVLGYEVGTPDLILLRRFEWAGQIFSGLAIEFKIGDAQMSAEQEAVTAKMLRHGFYIVVVNSVAGFIHWLQWLENRTSAIIPPVRHPAMPHTETIDISGD